MVHHSAEDYETAAKRAAAVATQRLEQLIKQGREAGPRTLQYVQDNQPKDQVLSAASMDFVAKDNRIKLKWGDREYPFHRNAIVQALEKIGAPAPTNLVDWLGQPDVLDEFSAILNKKYHVDNRRFLLRAVNEEVRGVLSDKYRRFKTVMLLDKLVEVAVKEYGAVPIEGRVDDLTVSLKLAIPKIIEFLPHQPGIVGLCFRHGDFGTAKVWVKGFVNLLYCTNLAMTEDALSQIHLGARLSEDIEFSERTYQLDSETMASALEDVTRAVLSPANIERRVELVRASSNKRIDADETLEILRKRNKVSKAEEAKIKELFTSADVENMPAGQTAWRLSNAISLLAHGPDADMNRQLELENLAGEVAGLHIGKDSEEKPN
jgi:hypothetical protein